MGELSTVNLTTFQYLKDFSDEIGDVINIFFHIV